MAGPLIFESSRPASLNISGCDLGEPRRLSTHVSYTMVYGIIHLPSLLGDCVDHLGSASS